MPEKDDQPSGASGGTRGFITISPQNVNAISKYLDNNPFPFYAIILGRESDGFIKDYVEGKWLDLHYMSGDDCLLLSVYPPKGKDKEAVRYWKNKLGGEYDKIMENKPVPSWSYEYARKLGIPFDKLPCIFFSTSLEKGGFSVKIPEWGEKDLTSMFQDIFNIMMSAAKLSEGERIKRLEDGIGKYYTLKLGKIYVKNHWMEYVSPKETAKAIIEILIAGIVAGLKAKVGAA